MIKVIAYVIISFAYIIIKVGLSQPQHAGTFCVKKLLNVDEL